MDMENEQGQSDIMQGQMGRGSIPGIEEQIEKAISPYVDTTDEGVVKVCHATNTVILNTIRVPLEHLLNIEHTLKGSGYKVMRVDVHPNEVGVTGL